MKSKWIFLLCAVGLTTLGCTVKSEPDSSAEESLGETSLALSTAAFSGIVTNGNGVAIAGATIVVNGVTRTTDAAGKYFCSVLASASGYKISITKVGFAPEAEYSSTGNINALHTLKDAYVQQINPAQNNTIVSTAGASVTIAANSLVDANGVLVTAPVNISISTYDPLHMPGDFTAVNAAQSQVALESVGAISVSAALVSNGAALKLKSGATADAFIPVPPEAGVMPSCVANNTCRLAMWRFDTVSGKWQERAANMKVSASGTTFTMASAGASIIADNGGLGTWNADIEKTSPACTIVEFVGVPQECYTSPGSSSETGVQLIAKLPNSSSSLITKTQRVTSAKPFVVLYNIRANAMQDVGVSFPSGVPAYCAGNLVIESDMKPAAFYPVLNGTGGTTRFDSGAPWGGTGFPTKPGTTTNITYDNVTLGEHTCGSHVYFYSSDTPMPPTKKAMTWSLLSSASPNSSNAYALVGADAVTNPYQGDTSTNNTLPVLCINKNNPLYPGAGVIGSPVQTPGGAWRKTWSGGTVALTAPVKGTSLSSLAAADALCASEFGAGYRMAEHHDGDPTLWSSWDFWGAALNANISTFQGTRFWASINDQNANLW